MSTMPITMLSGLGCGCQQTQQQFGLAAVSDYDIIVINGKQYTANQLLDKTVTALKDTKLYSGARLTAEVKGVVKAGQPIGKVISYIKANSPNSGGIPWLMFETTYGNYFFVPDDNISNALLKEQGTQTVEQEVKKEQDEQLRLNSPVEYYLKKYGPPTLLIIGGIIAGVAIVKEVSKGVVTKVTATT